MRSGLVSVTFRASSRREVVDAAVTAGLEAIEWGGDIHVPHGDIEAAKDAADLCADAGIRIPTYGSYYRLGDPGNPSFAEVLETASVLGAGIVRIWAGNTPSTEIPESARQLLVDECRMVCEQAGRHGMLVATEYHGGTLTDTNESARRFLDEVAHPALRTYWQPPIDRDETYRQSGLEAVVDRTVTLHVFHWAGDGGRVRRPLAEGGDRWREYLRIASRGPAEWALLEFIRADTVENLIEDAHFLGEVLLSVEMESR